MKSTTFKCFLFHSTSKLFHPIPDILNILRAPKTSWAKIMPSLEEEGREKTEQANPESCLVGKGREESRAEEERKGVGKARNILMLLNFNPSQC